MEQRVDVGHEPVTPLKRPPAGRLHLRPERPRLLIDVALGRVRPGEWEERPKAHPASEELAVAVICEAANIRPGKRLSREPEVDRHRDRHVQVLPCRGVIPGPCRAVPLTAKIVRAREHKGSLAGVGIHHALARRTDHLHAVHIVVAPVVAHAAQLGVGIVDIGLGHRLGLNIEHGRLVHVVPDAVDVVRHELLVQTGPPLADLLVEVVGEHTHARPDLARVGLSLGVLDPHIVLGARVVDEVSLFPLHAGVDHPDVAEADRVEVVVEPLGIGELLIIKGENPVAVHVIDVHPDDIGGQLAAAELVGDLTHAGVGVVRVAALVIPDRPSWRHGDLARQLRQPLHHRLRRFTIDQDHRELVRHPLEGNPVGQIDLAPLGGVRKHTECRAVLTHRQHPRLRGVQVLGIEPVAEGIEVPGLRDKSVAEQGTGDFARAVQACPLFEIDVRDITTRFVAAELRRQWVRAGIDIPDRFELLHHGDGWATLETGLVGRVESNHAVADHFAELCAGDAGGDHDHKDGHCGRDG